MFKDITKENLFHAYICEGSTNASIEVENFIAGTLGMPTHANQDVFIKHYDTFGINDSREITRLAQLLPLGERKILCLSTPTITVEAQDALLKLFEEPPERTHFFVVLPSVSTLRPTLLSRVQILRPSVDSAAIYTGLDAVEFIEANYAERLDIVGKIAKDKDRAGALELINSVEVELYKNGVLKNEDTKVGLEAIAQARRYLSDKGSMLKQLLESVALQVPAKKN